MKLKALCILAIATGLGCLFAAEEAAEEKVKPIYNYPTELARPAGTDLRVVSYNILSDHWAAQPIAKRLPEVAIAIHQLQPDFAGLQELLPIWYKQLESRIFPWKFARKPYDSTMCALIYDSRKYRQLDGGIRAFTNTKIRCLRWGLFEDINSGRKFIICNTHWDLTVPKRLKNSELMVKYLGEMQQKFPGIPVFCTGDYNSNVDSKEFSGLISGSGFKDAVTVSEVTENEKVGSWFSPGGRQQLRFTKHIDHIVFSGKVKALSAKLALSKALMDASDHLPIVVDFAFLD